MSLHPVTAAPVSAVISVEALDAARRRGLLRVDDLCCEPQRTSAVLSGLFEPLSASQAFWLSCLAWCSSKIQTLISEGLHADDALPQLSATCCCLQAAVKEGRSSGVPQRFLDASAAALKNGTVVSQLWTQRLQRAWAVVREVRQSNSWETPCCLQSSCGAPIAVCGLPTDRLEKLRFPAVACYSCGVVEGHR